MLKQSQNIVKTVNKIFMPPSLVEEIFIRQFPELYRQAMDLFTAYNYYMEHHLDQDDVIASGLRLRFLMMQVISWILFYRGFQEGDLSSDCLRSELAKIHIVWGVDEKQILHHLPTSLAAFALQLYPIQNKIVALHRMIMTSHSHATVENPVQSQLQYLRSVFAS